MATVTRSGAVPTARVAVAVAEARRPRAFPWHTAAVHGLLALAVIVIATESGDQLLRKVSTFREVEAGVWRRSYEEHRLRLWPAESVVERLGACGFRVQALPGYAGGTMPPSLHAYLATKPG